LKSFIAFARGSDADVATAAAAARPIAKLLSFFFFGLKRLVIGSVKGLLHPKVKMNKTNTGKTLEIRDEVLECNRS
jgi:hypothetical protein